MKKHSYNAYKLIIPLVMACIFSSCTSVSQTGLTLYYTTPSTGEDSGTFHQTSTTRQGNISSDNQSTTSATIGKTLPGQSAATTTKKIATTTNKTPVSTKKPAATTKKITTTTRQSTPKVNDDPWKYPYDLDYIYADCKREIERYGIRWNDNLTIDNASWDNPESTVFFTNNPDNPYGLTLKKEMFEQIKYYCTEVKPSSMRVYLLGPFSDFLGNYYPKDYQIYYLIEY